MYLYRRASGIYFVRLCVPARLKAAVGKSELHRLPRSPPCEDRCGGTGCPLAPGHWGTETHGLLAPTTKWAICRGCREPAWPHWNSSQTPHAARFLWFSCRSADGSNWRWRQ